MRATNAGYMRLTKNIGRQNTHVEVIKCREPYDDRRVRAFRFHMFQEFWEIPQHV